MGLLVLLVLACLAVACAGAKGPHNLFAATVKNYGFAEEPLENGSHIVQVEDNEYHIFAPGNDSHPYKVLKYDRSKWESMSADDGNQWLAWYFKSYLGGASMGFTSFTSKWVVPPLPTKKSNLAIFNSLQASYDPRSYNYILQPVLSTGSWMSGYFPNTWTHNSVMCPAQGSCLYTKPQPTQPGHTILGTIRQLSGSPNSYKFEVNITDLTAGTPTQTLQYSTKYFAPMALVSLEHNPAGSLKSCDELPSIPSLDFVDNVLGPTSMDMWQGSQSEMTCGLGVDIFAYDEKRLSIRL